MTEITNWDVLDPTEALKKLAAAVNASSGALQVATTVRISSAQLLALNTSPILLVPAPGAGKAVVPISLAFAFTYNSVAYENSLEPDLYTGPVANSDRWGAQNTILNAIEGTSDSFSSVNSFTEVDAITNYDNHPLYFSDAQNWTTGNGTFVVTVAYIIVPTV